MHGSVAFLFPSLALPLRSRKVPQLRESSSSLKVLQLQGEEASSCEVARLAVRNERKNVVRQASSPILPRV
ncbi:hypothetical protein LZ31DRAFT_285556 [Colletotrichum somersetense]|nr:hypothetical protein LZ31DRAFT_285556 [Colletotrichum somersetense]